MNTHTYADALVMSQKTHERKPADFYPTPADVTVALMEHLQLPQGTVAWEPACGGGHMSVVLEAYLGPDHVWSSDLRGDGIRGHPCVDFLTCEVNTTVDWIITNPPFNLSHLFIQRALSIAPNAAFLLKSQYWHAQRRSKLFEDNPPALILPLTWRPAFLEKERGRSPLMDVMWVVWKRGEKVRGFQLLQRPDRKLIHARFNLPHSAALDQNENIGLYSFDDLLGETDTTETGTNLEGQKDALEIDEISEPAVSGVGADFADLLL